MIDELHCFRDGEVSGLFGDQRVHLLADAAVGGMTLRRSAQLDEVHGLARVHLHIEADAVGHRDRVLRRVANPSVLQGVVQCGARVHDAVPVVAGACFTNGFRFGVAVARRQRLPFERQEPVPLQVTKGAVVGKHIESVRRPLERAAGPVAPVGAISHICAKDCGALFAGHPLHDGDQLIVGQR